MVGHDFSRRKISQSVASKEPNGHLLNYWMKVRFVEWNTGRLEEAGRRLPRDADGTVPLASGVQSGRNTA